MVDEQDLLDAADRMSALADRVTALESENFQLREKLESQGPMNDLNDSSLGNLDSWALGILGFDPADRPTPSLIRERYRDLVKQHHPDRGGDNAAFRRVMEATDRLEEFSKV